MTLCTWITGDRGSGSYVLPSGSYMLPVPVPIIVTLTATVTMTVTKTRTVNRSLTLTIYYKCLTLPYPTLAFCFTADPY